MKTLLVEYDLSKPGQNYDGLIKYLKSFPGWANHLKSAWLIKTDLTPSEVRDGVAKCVDTNDKVMVIDVTGRTAAWRRLSQQLSDWIQKNL